MLDLLSQNVVIPHVYQVRSYYDSFFQSSLLFFSIPLRKENIFLFFQASPTCGGSMNQKLTFEPRVNKEFEKKMCLSLKKPTAVVLSLWVHDWKLQVIGKIDPNIPNTKDPKPEENGIMYKSMMNKTCRRLQKDKSQKPSPFAGCRENETHASVILPSTNAA